MDGSGGHRRLRENERHRSGIVQSERGTTRGQVEFSWDAGGEGGQAFKFGTNAARREKAMRGDHAGLGQGLTDAEAEEYNGAYQRGADLLARHIDLQGRE